MEDRRTLRSLIRAGALAAALLVAACGSSPDPEPDDNAVPLPATELAPPAGADGSGDGETPDTPQPDGTSTDAAAADDAAAAQAPEGAGTSEEEVPVADAGPPPRWFPGAGAVVRLAGLSPDDGTRLLETRTVSARPAESGDGETLSMTVVITADDAAGDDIARERYIVRVTDDAVRVAFEPDGVRDIPAPTRELSRVAVVGDAWPTSAGRCEVEAVGEDVTTFTGTRSGCVRIALTSRTGSRSTRWFDPELGEIRREVRDRRKRLVAAWALCGVTPPAPEQYRPVLLGEE